MKLVKVDFKKLKGLWQDSICSNGSYILVSATGQINQVKLINGKFYDDFDCATHYPISDKRLKEWDSCYFIKGLKHDFGRVSN